MTNKRKQQPETTAITAGRDESGALAPALWASVATLAAASLPRWAREMYGWPTFPGHELFTNRGLVAFRKSALKLPEFMRMSPHARAAIEHRDVLASTSE